MAQDTAKIRLFVEAGLGREVEIALHRDQAHCLFNVMRQKPGDAVLVFNGHDGEWRTEKACEVGCRRLTELPFDHAVSLGPRILCADTAAVAVPTLWQASLGDWP